MNLFLFLTANSDNVICSWQSLEKISKLILILNRLVRRRSMLRTKFPSDYWGPFMNCIRFGVSLRFVQTTNIDDQFLGQFSSIRFIITIFPFLSSIFLCFRSPVIQDQDSGFLKIIDKHIDIATLQNSKSWIFKLSHKRPNFYS